MGKVGVMRFDMAERTVERLNLTGAGDAVLNWKTRRGVMKKRSRPSTVRTKPRIIPWVKERRYLLVQAGDGDSLDQAAGAGNDYRLDKRATTYIEMDSHEDECTNERLIEIEKPPMRYSIAKSLTTMALVVVFAALLIFTVSFVASGGLEGVQTPDLVF